MWFKVKSFILFLFKSTNQHGVHSPFVYNLITKSFYKKTNTSKINLIDNAKQWLLTNNKNITVIHSGKGMKVFNKNERKVSDILNVARIRKNKTALLLRILEYFEPQNILEIGTSVGLGTITLSVGSPKAKIETLEDFENKATIAQELFNIFNLKNIQLTIGNINKTLPTSLSNNLFDLIYFGRNHQKEDTLRYFNLCLQSIHNNSIFIFDDIYQSVEMQQAWSAIKKHPKVTVSIDTFYWGLIFFRKEQEKQHFTIRV